MRRFLFTAAAVALVPLTAMAQSDPARPHTMKTDGSTESGWVVSIPAGSSDFFNVRYDNNTATAVGITVAVADFGALSTYPRLGIYGANLGVDATGNTPDLSNAFVELLSPSLLTGQIGPHEDVPVPATGVTGLAHVAVQFPPGDSGLMGVHADTDTSDRGGNSGPGSPDPFDASFFTTDGYSSVAVGPFGAGDFGLGIVKDPVSSTFEGAGGTLKLTVANGDLTGDFNTVRVIASDDFGLYIAAADFGNPAGTLWLLFISFLGAPILPVGPVLPTLPGSPGSRFIRIASSWPFGAGGITINFVAITGAPGVPGSVGITNEVTVSSLADPNVSWGANDDGSYETGWVVQIPSASSDYFCSAYGNPPGATTVDLALAAMDFGATVSSYPRSGLAAPNTGLDGTGLTPDIAFGVYAEAPAFFTAGTFVTTSGQLVTVTLGLLLSAADAAVGFIQFPPGDPGLLGIGGDTNSTALPNKNGWTLNAFTTPANAFGVNWGLRAQ